eukprot:CAMPEP_0119470250 /NCGR_PEP_ID=MMETSP1344-20130328/3231_1 /TAXON_ID=236787 /ORGANISM="Florenciella parvula, Strain CCMP2471" /LENGTH=48 /DNA_ID= /DNA_START= /DNA_END= /DNA_ORIENTATION=
MPLLHPVLPHVPSPLNGPHHSLYAILLPQRLVMLLLLFLGGIAAYMVG